jgi:GH25 family lysozyme M1 (1,4-beta-N-acetylmuramidase)
MYKILDFLQSLIVDANIQAKILLTILHLPLVILLAFLIRQEVIIRRRKIYHQNLVFILMDFNEFCRRQYQAVTQAITVLQEKKRNDVEDSLIAIASPEHLNRQWILLLQNPEIFLTQKIILKAGSKLAIIRDQVRFQQENMLDHVKSFLKEYKTSEKQYYRNIAQLAGLHDSLEDYKNGRSSAKGNEMEWLSGYFKIFGDWFRNGANKDIETTYHAIVEKILQLNKAHKDIPLVFQANELALKCEMAYEDIVRMETSFLERLRRFAWHHKLAARMTTLIIGKMVHSRYPGRDAPRYIGRSPLPLIGQFFRDNFPDFDPLATRGRKTRAIAYAAVFLLMAISLTWVVHPLRKATQKPRAAAGITVAHRLPDSTGVPRPAPPKSPAKTLPAIFSRPVSVVYGIDISRYQGNLLEDIDNMDTLHFVICKATEGKKYVDPDFVANWTFIRKRGLVRGAYHFYLTGDDPVRQAQHFLETVKDLDSTDLPPVVDVEDGSILRLVDTVTLPINLMLLLRYMQQVTGRKPVIYTDLYFANKYLLNDSFAAYPLWLAEYSGNSAPRLPIAWKRKGYAIWQKKDSYRIDSKQTDFDVFNGSGDKLVEFIRQH